MLLEKPCTHGTKVDFVVGEVVLAMWPEDGATAYYPAEVTSVDEAKLVTVVFDGDKADCYRPVKRTKVVRLLEEPESRPDDDSHDVLDALEAAASGLKEGEGDRGDAGGSDKDQRKRERAR